MLRIRFFLSDENVPYSVSVAILVTFFYHNRTTYYTVYSIKYLLIKSRYKIPGADTGDPSWYWIPGASTGYLEPLSDTWSCKRIPGAERYRIPGAVPNTRSWYRIPGADEKKFPEPIPDTWSWYWKPITGTAYPETGIAYL